MLGKVITALRLLAYASGVAVMTYALVNTAAYLTFASSFWNPRRTVLTALGGTSAFGVAVGLLLRRRALFWALLCVGAGVGCLVQSWHTWALTLNCNFILTPSWETILVGSTGMMGVGSLILDGQSSLRIAVRGRQRVLYGLILLLTALGIAVFFFTVQWLHCVAIQYESIAAVKNSGGAVRLEGGWVVDAYCGRAARDSDVTFLNNFPMLRVLNLSESMIGDVGFAELRDYSKLRWLFLSGCRTGDEVAQYLRTYTGLEILWLDSTSVTDNTVRQLTELRLLRELRVDGTRVSDLSLSYMLGMEKLKRVDARGTDMTPVGVKQFIQRRPDVYVATSW